jgi:hypothetical protein
MLADIMESFRETWMDLGKVWLLAWYPCLRCSCWLTMLWACYVARKLPSLCKGPRVVLYVLACGVAQADSNLRAATGTLKEQEDQVHGLTCSGACALSGVLWWLHV